MNQAGLFRVMYFDHTALLGGGEIALLNLVRKLDRELVYPVMVLCSDGPLAEALRPIAEVHIVELSGAIRQAAKDGLGLKTFLKMGQVFKTALYIKMLRRFMCEHRIDIVHTNSLKADIIGGIAARLAGIPVIWHVRDRIAGDYLPGPVVKIFRFLAKWIPTFVIANSAATMQTLCLPEVSVKEKESRAVIHDGTRLLPEIVDRPIDGLLQVGLIGRICPWKGQDIFIQAVARVKRSFPNARFKIIGAALFGEQEFESRIRALCTQLGLEDVVEFAGFCPDISLVLRDLDLVVHASTSGEPFGQVIIEGMAAGKAVVATNGGGVPEIVVHNETGLLVPMGDVVEMADAICQLLGNRDQRLHMGRKGRERVQNYFTLERTVAHVESVYSTIATQAQFSGSSLPAHQPLSV
jgi:glycosyltransferase involved in cell wall biosynthesis